MAQYVMLAAAELTHDKGYGHFAIVGNEDAGRSATGYSSSCTAYGCYGSAYAIDKPKDILTIEMFAGPKPADAPSNVFNAATVINTIRSEIAAGPEINRDGNTAMRQYYVMGWLRLVCGEPPWGPQAVIRATLVCGGGWLALLAPAYVGREVWRTFRPTLESGRDCVRDRGPELSGPRDQGRDAMKRARH